MGRVTASTDIRHSSVAPDVTFDQAVYSEPASEMLEAIVPAPMPTRQLQRAYKIDRL
jgi:hypothetical protein